MVTIHLIYPHGSKISTPDAIGRNLAASLAKKYNVRLYDWDSSQKIGPNAGDLLVGHAHPNPWTIFRRSMRHKEWSQVILLQPFTTYGHHIAYLEHVIGHVDKFAAITGKYWSNELEVSRYSHWKEGFFQIELAVSPHDFPALKNAAAEPGKRRFLYIGNADPCKDLPYLQRLAGKHGAERFGSIGAYPINGIKWHGLQDFSTPQAQSLLREYDFLIMTSYADANPTVVLEAMSWGLVPICTPQCGYLSEDGVLIIASNDLDTAACQLRHWNSLPAAELDYMIRRNRLTAENFFSWEKFSERIQMVIDSSRRYKGRIPARLTQLPTEVLSNKFFLRPSNLKGYLQKNFKAHHAD